jgi:arginyl-tRNA synthetase
MRRHRGEVSVFPEALHDAVVAALRTAHQRGALADAAIDFVIERPRDRDHGDWATNAAMVGAKAAGMPPRDLAALIVENLPRVSHLDGVDIAGPGFINFRLSRDWYLEVLRNAAAGGPDHARDPAGSGEKIQVEFVSSNPNGPLHIGHGRGGVVGDVIARVLGYAGHDVQREYYYNDAGAQMTRYAASLEAGYRRALGEEAEIPEDGYHGSYVTDWGSELAAERGDALLGLDEDARRVAVLEWGLQRAMRDIEETLEIARIPFDEWFSERTLHERGEVDAALDLLRRRDQVYESDGATWFRTTEYGDEKDRVLLTSDGRYTYLAPDVAYHRDKFERGFDRVINIWGADHHGYIPRMKAAVEALGYDPDRLEIVITQMVNLSRGGEPIRMSMRAGEFVTFREVLEEVGPDATRYFLAAFSPDTTINFDLVEAKRQSMDNPVYYLQYAHARMRSLEEFAAAQGVMRRSIDEVDLGLLTHPAEIEVLKQADRLREEVHEAAAHRAPHRITAYGYDVATAFHRFYTDCRIVTDDAELTQARLWLVEAAKSVMLAVLGLLGISAPDRM